MQHIENDRFMIKTTFIETNKESIKMKGISQALKNVDEVKTVAAELQRNSKTNLFYCLWCLCMKAGCVSLTYSS